MIVAGFLLIAWAVVAGVVFLGVGHRWGASETAAAAVLWPIVFLFVFVTVMVKGTCRLIDRYEDWV